MTKGSANPISSEQNNGMDEEEEEEVEMRVPSI